MEATGLGGKDGFELPMNQAELADALGLTAIHLNRRLKALCEEGLISYERRSVTIIDFPRLAQVGDFDPRYLHLEAREDSEAD